ncbi:ribonuclease domain-containing protein [Chryseobacterium sp. A301]
MKSDRNKKILFFFIGAMTMFIALFFINSGDFRDLTGQSSGTIIVPDASPQQIEPVQSAMENKDVVLKSNEDIKELTRQDLVISYVKENGQLPSYYLTKSQAKHKGWIASEGNLCEILPGQAIGGDIFGNREKLLPIENTYMEADVNYNCGQRGKDRIVFTKKGEVWLSKDHYRSFQKQ